MKIFRFLLRKTNAKFESFVKIIDFLKAKEHENFQILTEKNK